MSQSVIQKIGVLHLRLSKGHNEVFSFSKKNHCSIHTSFALDCWISLADGLPSSAVSDQSSGE